MSTVVLRRAPRRAAPPMPTGELFVDAPPVLPPPTGARWQQWLTVLPMLAGTAATAMMFGGREGASAYTYVVGAIFGLSTLGMLVTQWGGTSGPRKAELMQARRDYLRYLSGLRRRVRATVAEQRAAMCYRHPDPDTLATIGTRVWERRPADADFGVVRVGLGPQALAAPLVAPTVEPTVNLEPVTAGALRHFLDAYSVVADLPIAVAIRSFARIVVRDDGPDGEPARALVRAVICQLAALHAPADLMLIGCVTASRRATWEWLKWLPHALHPSEVDALGPRRLVVGTRGELDELLASTAGRRPAPHVVVLLDSDGDSPPASVDRAAGLTVIEVGGPRPVLDRATVVLTVTRSGALHSATLDEQGEVGAADGLAVAEAEGLARRLAPLRLPTPGRDPGAGPVDRELTELLGLPEGWPDPATLGDAPDPWRPRAARDRLRVPIGTGPAGEPVELDLKESAQDGMGPHGLLVGATGSGKSELLRTLVLGLAATHPPDALNFVLIDFKGGATFATMDRLPHTSAIITNLAAELPLVDRMTDALNGELVRRQELLRRSGNYASVREYDQARSAGAGLPALPTLLVICDEFTELLAAKPDLIELFVQIGRVGRSLGVHLLLASQRLDEGRLRGLETHLSYRIGLRTFSAMESRAVLGVPDAYELPRTPGHGFLKFGTEPLQRFTTAYVSGPYRPRRTVGPSPASPTAIMEYTTRTVPRPALADPPAEPGPASGPSLAARLIDRLAGRGVAAHRVWLPPLADAPTLDELLGELSVAPGRGLTVAGGAHRGGLRVPVALVDRPFDQRRDVHWLDLAGSAGHVAIVGGPQAGKSTAARTLVTALALTHTPTEVQVYGLDFGGGTLGTLRDLPHVGGVAGRLDVAAVRRTVGELATLLADRERHFAEDGVESMAALRRQLAAGGLDRAAGLGPAGAFGDVVLAVDGWATLRTDFEDLEPVLVDLATRGLSYGIHLVATANRWLDFRANVRDLFGSRLELRLGDPNESIVNRRSAANVPERAPGRGLTADGLHLLTALPRTAAQEPAELVKAIAAAYTGPTAAPVRLLPDRLPYSSMLDGAAPLGTGLALPLGIAEADLRPVLIDFATEPHLVTFGDGESGKSSLLRSLAESITRRFAPAQARIVLIDYRRSLLGAVATEHLIGYGATAEDAGPLLQSVADYMHARRPGPEVTADQLRSRSWWTGPECFVLVDDYDLVATGAVNPLLALLDHLAHARDVGLHLVLVRRCGGAGRALFEPVLQRLRELGTAGLVLSGQPEEGALVGTVRPAPMPPGRGRLVTRREGVRLIQLAHLAP